MGRQSGISGKPFPPGQRVVSFLHLDATGQPVRTDLLGEEVAGFAAPGPVLCRWERVLRDRPREESEQNRAFLASAEELFLALQEAEPADAPPPEGGAPAAAAAAQARETAAVMRYLLTLLLERRRVLKPVGGRTDRWVHTRTKQEYQVTPVDLTAERVRQVQDRLAVLVG